MRKLFKKVKFTTLFLASCTAILAVSNFSWASMFYVAKNGKDTAIGSLKAPLLTVQAGINKADPGDTVIVKKGVYQERLKFPKNGAAGKPIKLVGEAGAIIDGGTPISKWTKVEGEGNVYRTPYTGSQPFNMTWNDKYILRIRDEFMNRSEGMIILRSGLKDRQSRSWDGVSAMWGTLNGFLYLGFGDPKVDPNKHKFTSSPNFKDGGAVIRIDNRKFITVQGLTLRNAYNAVLIQNNASDCIIEKNIMLGGRHTVEVMDGVSRLTVRNNKITLNYVYSLNPDNRRHQFIWAAFKNTSDWDRVCVNLANIGSDNVITDNHMYENFDGVQNVGTSLRLTVSHNLIENMADDGLEPTGEETDAKWHDNIVKQANIAYRHKVPDGTGTMYVYNNLFYSKTKIGIYWFRGNITPAYIYHNTFATAIGANFGSTTIDIGLPNVWLINNIFSCNRGFDDSAKWKLKPNVDYNYFGSNHSEKLPWWGDNNKIVKDGQLWSTSTVPNFKLNNNSSARSMGIDLSKPWTLAGKNHPALPGMKPGYFEGKRPDAGAIQYITK